MIVDCADGLPQPKAFDRLRRGGDVTVVGNTVDGAGSGQTADRRYTSALMSCVVPAGNCEVFEETPCHLVMFPLGVTDFFSITYSDGGGEG